MSKAANNLLSALPKRLRIGAQTYSITLVDFPEEKRVWGEFDSDKHVIRLSRTLPTRERVVETVIHEVLHGLWESRDLPQEAKEEQTVAGLAVALICLFKDNPQFLVWCTRALK